MSGGFRVGSGLRVGALPPGVLISSARSCASVHPRLSNAWLLTEYDCVFSFTKSSRSFSCGASGATPCGDASRSSAAGGSGEQAGGVSVTSGPYGGSYRRRARRGPALLTPGRDGEARFSLESNDVTRTTYDNVVGETRGGPRGSEPDS